MIHSNLPRVEILSRPNRQSKLRLHLFFDIGYSVTEPLLYAFQRPHKQFIWDKTIKRQLNGPAVNRLNLPLRNRSPTKTAGHNKASFKWAAPELLHHVFADRKRPPNNTL